ncbi:hypothetical protein D1AOALGA4SA_3548 [Olavius algarvensis Delta 1 endosymbiont]|nr:hypothetical protein D1AOALGA4SA_3548 [Olavius algarvensis Delta 1 endosymbiont]
MMGTELNFKSQISNLKQIPMFKIQNTKRVLFWSLIIEIWNLMFEICYFKTLQK